MRTDEVQILQLGSSPANLASLDNRAIDGAVLTLPTFFVAEERGYRLLADPVDLDIITCRTPSTPRAATSKRTGDQALRFVKGYCEGDRLFQKESDATAIAVMQKKLRIQSAQEKDVKYLEMSYNLLADQILTTKCPTPRPKPWKRHWISSPSKNPKRKGADAKLFLDESIVRELETSGFYQELV